MRVTYVIGYRHSNDRIINLRRVLEWLSGFQNIDIIIVEQDRYSKISHLNLRGKHIFIKNSGPYNMSWAFNVALKRCINPIIIFGDSDIIMDPQQFLNSINEINQYDVVSPYYSVLDLTPEESNLQFDMIYKISRPGRGETDNQKINLCGGIVIFRTETALKIGGWCESFEGWGAEDDFETSKIKKLGISNKEMPYKCFHLWHNRDQPDTSLYSKTLQLLQQLNILDASQLQMHINATSGRIGILSKYN